MTSQQWDADQVLKNPACAAVKREPIAKNLRKRRVPPKAAYRLAAEPR